MAAPTLFEILDPTTSLQILELHKRETNGTTELFSLEYSGNPNTLIAYNTYNTTFSDGAPAYYELDSDGNPVFPPNLLGLDEDSSGKQDVFGAPVTAGLTVDVGGSLILAALIPEAISATDGVFRETVSSDYTQVDLIYSSFDATWPDNGSYILSYPDWFADQSNNYGQYVSGGVSLPVDIAEITFVNRPSGTPLIIEVSEGSPGFKQLVEFSDSIDYPTLIPTTSVDPTSGVTSYSGFSVVNDLPASDVDFLAFNIHESGYYDFLDLRSDSNGEDYQTSTNLYDPDGSPVELTPLIDFTQEDVFRIDLSGLPAGDYVFEVSNSSDGDAAYQLDLFQDIRTNLVSSLNLIEDSIETFRLPSGFDWELHDPSQLPNGMAFQASVDFPGEYEIVGAPTTPGSFTTQLKASSEAGEKVETLVFNITNVNDAPVFSALGQGSASEDIPLILSAADIQASSTVSDIDDFTADLAFLIDAGSVNGELLISSDSGETYVAPTLFADAGTDKDVFLLGANDLLSWTSPLNFSGETTAFSLAAFDGELASLYLPYSIDVLAVNDLPALAPQQETLFTLHEDQQINGQLSAFDIDHASTNLTFSLVNEIPGFQLSSDGRWALDSSTSSYQSLREDETGEVTVDLLIEDSEGGQGLASLDFIVTGANDSPVASPVSIDTFSQGSGEHVIILPANQDIDGDQLFVSVDGPAFNGLSVDNNQLIFDSSDPAYRSLAASDSFPLEANYRITDRADDSGLSDVSSISINLQGTNDAPIFESFSSIPVLVAEDTAQIFSFEDLISQASIVDYDDNSSASFKLFSLAPGSSLEVKSLNASWDSAVALSSGDVISPNYDYRWSPPADINGSDIEAFSLQAWDGLAASEEARSARFDIDARPDDPTISTLGGSSVFSVNEGDSLQPIQLIASDVDDLNSSSLSLEITDGSSFFELTEDNKLRLKVTPDYEERTSFAVQVQSVDSTQRRSQLLNLVVDVVDEPDLQLSLSRGSGADVLLPSTRSMTIGMDFLQDDLLTSAQGFTATLVYDQRLTFDPIDSPLLAGLPSSFIDYSIPGEIVFSASNVDLASLSGIKLADLNFDILDGLSGDMSPYEFKFSSITSDSDFELIANGLNGLDSLIVSPDADEFIIPSVYTSPSGSLDLQVPQSLLDLSPLSSLGPVSVSTVDFDRTDSLGSLNSYNGVVKVLNLQADGNLDFEAEFFGLKATNDRNNIVLDQSADVHLLDGDDLLDLQAVTGEHFVSAQLGAGQDTVILPQNISSADSHQILIRDFELGLDAIQLTDGGVLRQREDVLNHSLAQGVHLDFVPVAFDLNPHESDRVVLNGITPLLSPALALEPGTSANQLEVRFEDLSPNAQIEFDTTGSADGWSWSTDNFARTAVLTADSDQNPLSDLSSFKAALGQLTASVLDGDGHPIDASAQLSVHWLNASSSAPRSSATTSLAFKQAPSVLESGLDYSGPTAVNIDIRLPLSSSREAVDLRGSTSSDNITLLSSAFDGKQDNAIGGSGDDRLITGDGDRLFGGIGNDVLIATGGLGTTSLLADSGHDLLIGASSDVLVGAAGNDFLMARGGGNRMFGGAGADLFVLADHSLLTSDSNMSYNRVQDFNGAEGDKIVINLPGLELSDLHFTRFGQGTRISLSSTKAAELERDDRHLGVVSGVSADALRDQSSSLVSLNHSFADPRVVTNMLLANAFDQA